MTQKASARIGLIGLGTMGANLALNIAEKGFPIAVFNRTVEKTRAFKRDAGPLVANIIACETLEELRDAFAGPRAIILMVPAGTAVDEQISALSPLLDASDLIIDAGNANFRETMARAKASLTGGPRFLGIGVSGGEEGARHGPSIMGGGAREAWNSVEEVLLAIAARHEGDPCAAWMGENGAGHFVKTVHNGIEYADMQMIAEIYGVFRDGMGKPANEIGDIFANWNNGLLKSYLVEISAAVARETDPDSGRPVLDIILDRAGQKGTGRWTAVEAQHLASPVSAIEAAVAARNLSARLGERQAGEKLFGAAPQHLADGTLTIDDLEGAMIAGKILCYAQGFGLLGDASREFGWDLPLPTVARIWRAGCIIRSSMLNDMASALGKWKPGGANQNLMFSEPFTGLLKKHHDALAKTVAMCARHGLPAPALSASLSYFDIMRTGRSTANMIQAQRDFFGAHSFERIDRDGAHHGPWGSHPG